MGHGGVHMGLWVVAGFVGVSEYIIMLDAQGGRLYGFLIMCRDVHYIFL